MENSSQSVRAWEETVHIPTYPALAPDKNPMFLDKRVYQGSSGKVYPNPFTDKISDEKLDYGYRGVFLENEYIRLMILPEIGGRIHIGQDKTNHYDFFYRQNVIKPALVGLLGPWISGGVEFNWPQHHRPTTFMPVDHCIERHDDGSCTVWLSEHEPMNRMKGMVGICLHPGRSLVEAKVRLYNRTPFIQTFLWWANVAVRVHDQYQSFFPPDVRFVADHAKRAISSFPIARNFYYGVDYRSGVDLTWYKNIPVPTSYMVTDSAYDFFGGYDHAQQAGFVHVANRFVAPGKKQWTWGNAEFGYAWDRELTDEDGPYIELMAGAYTDNQPDFSFLQPYETKTFTQAWYPIREIGPAKNANRLLAVNLEPQPNGWRIGICATEPLENLTVLLTADETVLFQCECAIKPGAPFVETVAAEQQLAEKSVTLRVLDRQAKELIRYASQTPEPVELPSPATEPPPPTEIAAIEELYLTGLHLDQYRHATRSPLPYWEEALARDPHDVRCNNAVGLSLLRQGKFAEAELHFRNATKRLTHRNPNPYDGEPFYHLGLALKYQNKAEPAYAAFYKAAWNYAWQSAAYYELATIECARQNFPTALELLDRSLRTNADHLKARNLKTALLRRSGRIDEARALAEITVALDPLDLFSRYELFLINQPSGKDALSFFRDEAQTYLDIALDYASAGLTQEAYHLLRLFFSSAGANIPPMLLYTAAQFATQLGDTTAAEDLYRKAREASPDYCFPSRLEEMIVLENALRHQPNDARAHYYLGNLLYDKHRREEAIHHWEAAAQADPSFSIPWRNLGIAYYNVRGDIPRALASYEKAFAANPLDARLLYELDQLRKRTGADPRLRLRELQNHISLVEQRDDLTVELVTLHNQTGQHEKALAILGSRRFHPWEGGEGLVSGQYVAAHFFAGRNALQAGDAVKALSHFEAARHYPHNLGEGKHLLTDERHLDYFTGAALAHLHGTDEARAHWQKAASGTGAAPSLFTYYQALALQSLNQSEAARSLLLALRTAAERQAKAEAKIEYFATSLPNFLLFEDDLQKRNTVDALFLHAMANLGLGETREAIVDLQKVLELDKNHLNAHFELQHLETSIAAQQVPQP